MSYIYIAWFGSKQAGNETDLSVNQDLMSQVSYEEFQIIMIISKAQYLYTFIVCKCAERLVIQTS